MGIHLMASNFLARSTAENLNASHPIRRMLRPHTYGAVSVNLGAIKFLARKWAVLHRSVALTWESLKRGYRKSADAQRSARAGLGACCCCACALVACIYLD